MSPTLFSVSIGAPAASSIATTSDFPAKVARCSGEFPFCVGHNTQRYVFTHVKDECQFEERRKIACCTLVQYQNEGSVKFGGC